MSTIHNPSSTFSTDPTGLDESVRPAVVRLGDGDRFDLRIAPVAKQLDGNRVRMLAYSGSIPGPTLRVRQGSEITVHVRNDADSKRPFTGTVDSTTPTTACLTKLRNRSASEVTSPTS
jgi:FtsP/CotA-like multicopper oxidase with cupredoxin domain